MDLIFRSKNRNSPGVSPLEQAKENYMLMMGKDRLTPMEEQILEMLIERQAIAARLNEGKAFTCLRMRRARFFMRNLIPIEYKTLDGKQKVKLLVSPLTFLF